MTAPLMTGTVSVVMGGSTGIGLAVARCLAGYGSVVELAAVDGPGVAAAAEQIRAGGHAAHGTVVDAARPAQVERFFAAVTERLGRLAALVNSASIQRYGTAETTPVHVRDEVMDVNVRAMFLAAKHAPPLLRATAATPSSTWPRPGPPRRSATSWRTPRARAQSWR